MERPDRPCDSDCNRRQHPAAECNCSRVNEEDLHALICSCLSALHDLNSGYSWRELGVNVDELRDTAESLGVDVSEIFGDEEDEED